MAFDCSIAADQQGVTFFGQVVWYRQVCSQMDYVSLFMQRILAP